MDPETPKLGQQKVDDEANDGSTSSLDTATTPEVEPTPYEAFVEECLKIREELHPGLQDYIFEIKRPDNAEGQREDVSLTIDRNDFPLIGAPDGLYILDPTIRSTLHTGRFNAFDPGFAAIRVYNTDYLGEIREGWIGQLKDAVAPTLSVILDWLVPHTHKDYFDIQTKTMAKRNLAIHGLEEASDKIRGIKPFNLK